ncbi:putative STE STE11 cdc15 protein kinase [Lyophyllum shimeji]|uniref:STE STE11 cdc15 protein kinase n=1 Tax=Lyophyllum shimeji TaxID=47721 RepID=A0A9P3PUQ7_LYOSH|nr:putative STE STE11 cdc15 protein kinase [Lyophyllum shimeji]
MTAAVLPSSKVPVSSPFHLPSRHVKTSHAPSSRSQQLSELSDASPSSSNSKPTPAPQSAGAFGRIRSSLEQSLRTATRSKKVAAPPVDDFATITARNSKGKEKEKPVADEPPRKEKERSGMLRRLESKVTFRRADRETPSPLPPAPVEKDPVEKVRAAGFTSFVTPSMRQGSMSSPSLHLSSQALPSPKSRPAIPASSSSNSEALATPTRERTRRQSLQPTKREISAPAPLGGRRESHGAGHVKPVPNQTPTSRHRATKSVPVALPSLPFTPPAPDDRSDRSGSSPSPDTPTPTGRTHDLPSPPGTPTPRSGSGNQLARASSRRAAASSGHLPLSAPPASPINPRASSPIRPRPTRVVAPRGLSSSSASHLPLTPSSPSPTTRRPSVDGPRRPSAEIPRKVSGEPARRPSVDSPRRPSLDFARPSRDSPVRPGGESPAPRLRSVSPTQRSYAQNRHFNMSTLSLSPPSNPEHRELIRTATSLLCKEIIKIPPHMSRTESGLKDWEEVEVRTRALVRAERIWGKAGGIAGGSSSNLNSPGASGMSASAEERERRLFGDALRDGYVLCQLLNKLRSASVVKPDARDDGILRTSNVTKFLAACSSYGLPDEDLFQCDDLTEATGESLARVAGTIIALVKFVDTPVVNKSKYLNGQAKKPAPISIPGPYNQGGASSRATASTPNLVQPSASPTLTSPSRKRYSPPNGLPPVRSDSPSVTSEAPSSKKGADDADTVEIPATKNQPMPKIMAPPPRSPLRMRPKRNDDTELTAWAKTAASPPHSSLAEPSRTSMGSASVAESFNARQSMMTETTMTTDVSSILDFRQPSGNNKFGTIRTVTTDATSEAPSMTRTEASAIADELARKKSTDSGLKHHRDRKLSEAPVMDMLRVVEEGEESASSSTRDRGNAKASEPPKVLSKADKAPAVHLHKGKWPDDFMDAFQPRSPPRAISPKSPNPDEEGSPVSPSPISVSPPRKLAIVGASRRSESVEALPQFPRRPTHRARQSVDAPILMPKELRLGRDTSPDGAASGQGGRIIIRRHSTRPGGPQRNAVYLGSHNEDSADSGSDSPVPFPRTVSGEHGGTPSPVSGPSSLDDRPRVIRGRFQSDINDSSARLRPRPISHDELGAKPMRSRFESMVNLGVGSANASASDLLSRDSLDGSAVRKTLVLREDGKPPTHFQLGNCIGRGQFGSVYRALNLNTGQMVAVKRIRLEGLKEEEVTTLMREVDLVKSLSHPSIVKYEGMARDADTLSIVLEYAENGSLGQTLKAFGKLNERLVASYVVKILEGLHYLHTSDVVHCDLKAANILTTKNGNVKLSDFGVSLNLRAMEREIKDVAGTPNWMAPEVIELKGASTKSDIWSLACTVIELLTGRPPYADVANSMSVMFRIVEDDMPPLPESCSPLLQNFLTQCFHKDPKKRPDAETLCEHPWLKQNWGIHKELRPQDSIPFLRRVSADLQKSEFVRYLSQIDMPETPTPEGPTRMDDKAKAHRPPEVSILPLADNDISPREHSFVKTTFSKPMVCRVCLLNVKKSAVLCAQCSLIAHSKCAVNAPPTCDLRAQLLLYAKYAEKGNPASVYSNPAEGLREFPASPASDVPYVAHSRTSIDAPSPSPPTPIPPQPVHPPTAYRFMGAFKRSRSNLSPEPKPPPASSSAKPASKRKADKTPRRKGQSTTKPGKDRPHSITSNSTDLNSMRSAATAAESVSSRHDRRSVLSSNGTDVGTRRSAGGLSENAEAVRPSKVSARSEADTDYDVTSNGGHIPGSMPVDTRRPKKREKSPGCSVQ